MSWARARQLIYLSIVFVMVGGTLFLFAAPYVFKPPTCIDGKQNGREEGKDCGGECEKLCVEKLESLKVVWARSFEVAPGLYDAFAYVENHNRNAAIRKILYKFSLYDDRNLLVATRVGKTYIGPNGPVGIFEPSIQVGGRNPKRTFFEFAEVPLWERVPEKALAFGLVRGRTDMETPTTTPRLSVTIENPTIYRVGPVEVTAILYGEDGNAIGVSRSLIDQLVRDGEGSVVFTWLRPFFSEPTRIEVISRVDLFGVPF